MRYSIGDFSSITRLSIKTLRYYHEIGLLPPAFVERQGYRYYDERCIAKARAIRALKDCGFSLESISDILAHCTEDASLLSHMEQQLKEIDQRLLQYMQMQDKIRAFVRQEKAAAVISSDTPQLKQIVELRIASIRFCGCYKDIAQHIEALYASHGEYADGRPFCLYYDSGSMDDHADIEVCLPVLPQHAGAHTRVLAGGKALCMLHNGPYEAILRAYKSLVDAINLNKHHEMLLPTRECYLKGPGMILKGDPDQYVTEIQFMLR